MAGHAMGGLLALAHMGALQGGAAIALPTTAAFGTHDGVLQRHAQRRSPLYHGAMNFLALKIPPVALVLLFAAGMGLVAQAVPSLGFPLPGRVPIALAIAAIGAGFCLAGVRAFRAARTTVNPMTPGATTQIVTHGVYRISRNPMYVGFLLALLAWAVALAHGLAIALLPLFVAYMNRFQIRPEEEALLARFGAEYAAYLRTVRRWL